jgi:hypothetical protein
MSDQIEKQADESSIVIEAPVKKEEESVPVKKEEEEIVPVVEPAKEEEVVVPQVTPGHHSIHPGTYWH